MDLEFHRKFLCGHIHTHNTIATVLYTIAIVCPLHNMNKVL